MQTRNIKEIKLRARRWFQPTYGNTYFSCDIYVNNELVHEIGFEYGYGSHYETVAFQWLQDNIFSKQLAKSISHMSAWRICKDVIKCKFVSTAIDVNRKKDL